MPKYYVSTGDLQTIIDRPDPDSALVDAFRSQVDNCQTLGTITSISETGFELHDETLFYPTLRILELAGMSEIFDMPDWENDHF